MTSKNNNSPNLEEIYFNPEAGNFKQEEEPASVSDTLKLDDEDEPDLPIVSPTKKKKFLFKRLTLFLLFCCLIAVGFLVWQAYANLANPDVDILEDVVLEIIGPQEIISGKAVEYQIILKNNSINTIKNAEVSVRFPLNFQSLEFKPAPKDPAPESDNIIGDMKTGYFWNFSNIAPGDQKEILIVGQIFGEIGAKQIITALSLYQPENFSSDFKISSILETEISDTLVSLEIEAPSKNVDNAEIKYQIKINSLEEDSTANPLKNLRVFVEYPENFILLNVDPQTNKEGEQEYWLLDSLAEEEIITIEGKLSGEAGEYKELLVKVGYYVNDEFQLQTGESFITIIVKPELDISLQANGLEINSISADWNDELSYSLVYVNKGEVELSDIILKLNFSGDDIINWQSLGCDKAEDCDFLLAADNGDSVKTLIWTRDQLSSLETLIPGEAGIIKLKANLKDGSVSNQENYQLTAKAMADVKVSDLKAPLEIQSNAVDTKIRTKTKLIAEARYYTDEYLKIGSGPIPPLVGAPTTYRIFWQVENTSNALKNAKVTTTLPSNVSWENNTQVLTGALNYNSYNRKITWTIPSVPAYPSDVFANFEISVIPALSQLGEYLTLTQEAILEADDNFTNEPVSSASGYLTSELENDLRAQGKGRVE